MEFVEYPFVPMLQEGMRKDWPQTHLQLYLFASCHILFSSQKLTG